MPSNYELIYSPLHFYSSRDRQHYKKWYASGRIFPVIAPNNYMPPFQRIRAALGSSPINKLTLHSLENQSTINLLPYNLTIEIENSGTYDIIKHAGESVFSTPTRIGYYECEMSDGTNTWWSEIIGFVDNIEDFLKITWWNNSIMGLPSGHISFLNYKNFLYLDAELVKPLYPYDREIEDRGGHQFNIFGVSMKRYQFTTVLPEHVIDCIRLATIADRKEIISKDILYNSFDLLMLEPNWNEEGDAAVVNFEMRTDTIVSSAGGANTSSQSPWLLNPTGDDAWLL